MSSAKIELLQTELSNTNAALELQRATVDVSKKYLEALQQQVEELTQKILDKVQLKRANTTYPMNTPMPSESKESAIAFIQSQIRSVVEQQAPTREKILAERNLKMLLDDVARLVAQSKDFPQAKIVELIEARFTLKQGTNAFTRLLNTVNQNPDDYGFFTLDSTKTKSLLPALKTKIEALIVSTAVKVEYLKAIKNAQLELETLIDGLTNYDQKIYMDEVEIQVLETSIDRITKELEAENNAVALAAQQEQVRLQQEQARLQQIEDAKAARGLLVTPMVQTLYDYNIARAERFSLKDKISRADMAARNNLIVEIQTQLNEFIESGTTEIVLATIKQGITDFPGIHLKTALSKIAVQLMDAAAPSEQRGVVSQPVDYASYNEKVQALQDQLTQMANYGQRLKNENEKTVVAELVQALRTDLNTFHQPYQEGQAPSSESLSHFSDKFIARLHSADDVMNQQTSWKTIVANVAAAVLTLGIALGVKLAHSKITEGRAHLFFSQNTGEKTVAQLEESVKSMNNAAPGA